jgi:hypothetical protein
MTTPRWLTKDREQIELACFGFLFPEQNMFPEVLGITVENPYRFAQPQSNVLTTVILTSGSERLVSQGDFLKPVIYQRFAHLCQVALEDLYVAQLRTTETISEMRRKIEGFGRLNFNWDGEGAEPISAETINTALRVLENIAIVLERKNTLSAPSVRPFPNGAVFFKWIQGQKELSITVEGRTVEAQRWEPLDAFHSQGLWEITVDAISEHVEWVLA